MKSVTVGIDLGDRVSRFCVIDEGGAIQQEGRVRTGRGAFRQRFDGEAKRVVLEVGTHSPWVSRELELEGHEVIVANPRRLRFIYGESTKSDRSDAEQLARVGRFDPALLSPIRHRGEQAQQHLAILRSRDALVRARASLVTHVRGSVKAVGARLRTGSTAAFAHRVSGELPGCLRPALEPTLKVIEELTQQIRGFEREIARLCRESYPQTQRLAAVAGVADLTALAYVLVIEDPSRFARSRDVGPFLGLVPKRRQSGDADPQLGISKAGDRYLRRLLVGSAHYILGPFGPDCDLRRWGLQLAERGGPNAKKRAGVAVARKLAVLLHRLWVSERPYQPLIVNRDENVA